MTSDEILESILRAWDGGLYDDGTLANDDNAAKWMGLGNHAEGCMEPSVIAFYEALHQARIYFHEKRRT